MKFISAPNTWQLIKTFRQHPLWRLIGFPVESRKLHAELWRIASQPNFAYRRLYDIRLALVLQQQGVTDFATTNVKDFVDLGFKQVWNPLE